MITPLFLVLPYDRSIKRQAYKNIVEESVDDVNDFVYLVAEEPAPPIAKA